ncbi:MAG: single-stranded DNA-binding protein [Myxococcota bacterium]
MSLVKIASALSKTLEKQRFGDPVTHVYNPLDYAWAPHAQYLERYGQGTKEVLFFGMNPGPWGMAQTGVPFGEIRAVREFLGIEAPVKRPRHEHPARPIEGFACTRSEVSGARLWGWAEETFGTAERFFARMFVANYCPLSFMEASGKNRTPDKLPPGERDPLLEACDQALVETVRLLEPKWVIGIGAFAEGRAKAALKTAGIKAKIGRILHPSPASPLANQGWGKAASADLAKLGVRL